MPAIQLSQLLNDPRNANVCTEETLEKIKANIARTQLYEPLVVRPHPTKKKHYILINGHHRKRVLERLGYAEAECLIWNVDESEAALMLATLNRLHGEDNLHFRAKLMQELTLKIPPQDLAHLIPETPPQIEELLASLKIDFQSMDEKMRREIEKQRSEMPVPFSCMVAATDVPVIEKALGQFEAKSRGLALVTLCRKFLEVKNG